MKNNILLGAFYVHLLVLLMGAMFPVADHAFQYINPFYFTIIRYVPVAIILVILLYMIEGKKAFCTEGRGFSLWF